jgi:hypothetical protein
MQAPNKENLERLDQIGESIQRHVWRHYKKIYTYKDGVADAYAVCKNCGAKIVWIHVYISIHYQEWESVCAGSGGVIETEIPHCPNCEIEPEKSGCVHIPHPILAAY